MKILCLFLFISFIFFYSSITAQTNKIDTAELGKYYQIANDSCNIYSFNSINHELFLERYIDVEKMFGKSACKNIKEKSSVIPYSIYIINKTKTQYIRLLVSPSSEIITLSIGKITNKGYAKLNVIYSNIDSFFFLTGIKIGTTLTEFQEKIKAPCCLEKEYFLYDRLDIKINHCASNSNLMNNTDFTIRREYYSIFSFINGKLSFCEITSSPSVNSQYGIDKMRQRKIISK